MENSPTYYIEGAYNVEAGLGYNLCYTAKSINIENSHLLIFRELDEKQSACFFNVNEMTNSGHKHYALFINPVIISQKNLEETTDEAFVEQIKESCKSTSRQIKSNFRTELLECYNSKNPIWENKTFILTRDGKLLDPEILRKEVRTLDKNNKLAVLNFKN
jgi:hypothetical protein